MANFVLFLTLATKSTHLGENSSAGVVLENLEDLELVDCVDLENRCESDWDWSPRLSASDLFLSFKSTHPQFPDALSPR